jgi:hypothetical protein
VSARRRPPTARGGLVLVRGGLDAGASDQAGADWQALRRTIGWDDEPAPLPSDYEAALAARVLGADAGDEGQAKLGEPTLARFDDEADREAARAGRRWVTGVAVFVLGIAAIWALWFRAAEPPRAAAPHPAPDVVSTALDGQPEEPVPPDVERAREVEPEPHAPEPIPTARPKTSGARLAARARTGEAQARPAPSAAPEVAAAPMTEAPAQSATADALPEAPRAAAVAAVGPRRDDERWEAPMRPTLVGRRAAGFSLAPSGNRWLGFSGSPAPERSAPADLGVMAQVDVGRALSRF